LRFFHGADHGGDIDQIAVQQAHLIGDAPFAQAALGVRPATGDEAVDLVVLFQQQLGQIGAVLAGDAGDDCCFHNILLLLA